jgi:hypothetical protein
MLNRTIYPGQYTQVHKLDIRRYSRVSRTTPPQILLAHSAIQAISIVLLPFLTQRRLTKSFISEISLSTSSMNCMMKSTSLCFNISSVWKFVIKKEISYPYNHQRFRSSPFLTSPTLIGFLRKIKKASALCVRNLVNL